MLDLLSFLFLGITLLSLILFYLGTGRDRRVLLWSMIWMLLVGVVSYSGYFTYTSARAPRFLGIIFGAILMSILIYRTVRKNEIQADFLWAIHTLRFPVEFILFQLYLQQQVPILMTFKGWNYDILMGISALFILIYIKLVKRKLPNVFVMLWNGLGIILLTTIVAIAMLASPLPIQQLAFDQPNVAVLQFPFVYLPAFVVPIVYLAHFLTIKNVRHKK